MFNSYHIFKTSKGQGADVTTLFAPPSAFGPGGADASKPCVPDALRPVAPENPFRHVPQAQIVVIDGYDPVDATNTVVPTGLDFDAATYMSTGKSRMRKVADGVGTAPMGVRLAPDGQSIYVANYLARNVVRVAAAQPIQPASGLPDNLRCIKSDFTKRCGTNNDCPSSTGFCNHPGGAACTQDVDCGANGPCIRGADCVPLVLAPPVASIQGKCSPTTSQRCSVTGDCPSGETCDDLVADPTVDPVPAAVLDGKILFNTAARDASVTNGVGLGAAAPRFDDAALTGKVPGSVVSTSHDASYVTCSTCHADFGGQDGPTWQGALLQRSSLTSTAPADVNDDLSAPNRNLRANGKNVGVRLTHVADFVYSLTDFVRNPNPPDAAAERGRKIFNDPQTNCTSCHLGGPGAEQQFFTDKKPNPSFDPGQPGAADHNNPFVSHVVGTMNHFVAEDLLAIAQMDQIFQNPRIPIPASRGPLGDYLTPVLNDVWNTAPYLHDGSAHTLLDVVRPCDTTVDDCLEAGRGRNLNGQHGVHSIL